MFYNDEVILAKKIIASARSKKNKTYKDWSAIIDLGYFIALCKNNKETIDSKKILNKIQTSYYDEIYKEKDTESTKYKLSSNGIQYCFF